MSMVLVTVTPITSIGAHEFSENKIKDSSTAGSIYIDDSDVASIIVDADSDHSLFAEKPEKRMKRSYYRQTHCDFHRNNRKCRSYSGQNYYNVPPKHPSATPAYFRPAYNAPNYREPNSNPLPTYHSPNDYRRGYISPSSFNPSYYKPFSQHSPSYQSYNSQNYKPPISNSYSDNRNSNIYRYQPPRNIMTTSNLRVGCNPHVSTLADIRYLQQSQSHPSYRVHSSEQSPTHNPTSPEFNVKMTNSVPVEDNLTETASSVERARMQQKGTLSKMAQYHELLVKDVASAGEKLKKELLKVKN